MHSHTSSRADVVQHLLDPSYYSSHTSYNKQPRVYIDRKGNMHDPDYRHFPLVSSYASSSHLRDDEEENADSYVDPFSSCAPRRSASLGGASFYSSSPSSSSTPSPPDESPFDDLEPSDRYQRRAVRSAFRRRRDKRRVSLDSYMEEEEEPVVDEEASDEEVEEAEEADDDAHTPTCGEAIKRQWQSISFALNFGVFRARRRLKRVLSHH